MPRPGLQQIEGLLALWKEGDSPWKVTPKPCITNRAEPCHSLCGEGCIGIVHTLGPGWGVTKVYLTG